MNWRTAIFVALGASLLAGCVAPAEPIETGAGRLDAPRRGTIDLTQDGVERYAKEITYRVRNVGCDGVGTGSAFAISENILVSNRHVVEGSSGLLELSTWDGKDVSVDVSASAGWADVALIWTDQKLPVIAEVGKDPQAGESVAAVGYPLGGKWTLSSGSIIDYVPGNVFGQAHSVIRFDAPIAPGNSGGPLLNAAGEVVGVVFAVELDGAKLSLAIPISVLEQIADERSYQPDQSYC